MEDATSVVRVDASSFQHDLASLAQTTVEKVFREGVSQSGWPPFVSEDIATMLRYSRSVYNLMFYLNADERRRDDPNWSIQYGVSAISLIRSLIDCLYNVTAILQNPAERGAAYRRSGLRRVLNDLEDDRQTYAGQPEWEEWIDKRKAAVELLIGMSGFTMDSVMKQPYWQTLGTYLGAKQPSGAHSDHQQFLKTFTHLEWRQYSALSHGAFEAFVGHLGSLPVGAYYMTDFFPHEVRPKIDQTFEQFLSTHIGRAATVLLSILTEIQAYCKFEGANINQRLLKVWATLMPLFEAKEVYDLRYAQLMRDSGIARQN